MRIFCCFRCGSVFMCFSSHLSMSYCRQRATAECTSHSASLSHMPQAPPTLFLTLPLQWASVLLLLSRNGSQHLTHTHSHTHTRTHTQSHTHTLTHSHTHSPFTSTHTHTHRVGEDSFFQFMSRMMEQYMKEEEVRSRHRTLLLQLREKTLKVSSCHYYYRHTHRNTCDYSAPEGWKVQA